MAPSSSPRTLNILGSTGSIGLNTLQVVREHPQSYRVEGLAAGSKTELLEQQILEFSPRAVYLADEKAALLLSKKYSGSLKVFTPKEGLREFSKCLSSDILMAATTGTGALLPVMDALEMGKQVALANKEILVIAGELILSALKSNPRAILVPVDSEHSAIFQCLQGANAQHLEKIILTGSGGPLREVAADQFAALTKEKVINHPKWKMGPKISVDSATLMNKGLEIIEASALFGLPVERIEVLIHPEAVIHSMVEFCDGSVLAQLGVTDMKMPIQYALTYPSRAGVPASRRLDFAALQNLHFFLPDRKKFPCLDLAYSAAKSSGSAPCVLSAADEVAVGAYLEDKIHFVQIPRIIEKVLSLHRHIEKPTLEDIHSVHDWATKETLKLCQVF